MSFVDLMSNVTYTALQMNKRLKSIELKTYSARDEQVLNRLGTGVALGKRPVHPLEDEAMNNFNAFMEGMKIVGAEARADNQLLKAVIAYENAETRLTQYILLDGRLEQAYVPEVPATYDPDTGEELTPLVEAIPFISAVDPLLEFVIIYEEDENPVEIRNPLVMADEEARLAAQGIIDSASAEILDLVDLRSNGNK